MGSVVSSLDELEENELLKKLASTESINDNDPFWNKNVQKEIFAKLDKRLEELLYNTPTSGNFATLVCVFLRRQGELLNSVKCENKIFLWQIANALLILRYICTFFAIRLSSQEFVKMLEPIKTPDSDDEVLAEESEFSEPAEAYVNALVNIITTIPVNTDTLNIHAETIRNLLTSMSSQLYQNNVNEDSIFLRYLMRLNEKSKDLICRLLENFLTQTDEIPNSNNEKPVDSFVFSFASSMWSAFSRTVSTDDAPPPELDGELDVHYPPQTLASLSISLLLLLVCRPKFTGKENTHKEMLSLFQNAQEVSSLSNLDASFQLDFTALYNRLCETCTEKQPMLLLYMLLHTNIGFKNFVLSRINLENLVIPVLKVLNDGLNTKSFGSHSHQTYLAMIVILILSEDDFFCKLIHEVMIKNVTWYQHDRPISEISLGGLTIAVFSKTIHTNTVKTRDRYLHTNCLAALANMSSSFKHLSPYVSQKLIGLLETMTKRHARMIQMMRDNAEEIPIDDEEDDIGSDLHRDITALEEGIRMVLEVVNSALCSNLRYNSNLIYSILYKRDLFEQLHNRPIFHDLSWNIFMVINHFSSRVADASSTSVNVVLEAIEKAAITWPTDRLKKFPDLKYRYVEDENTIDFFVPYGWRLVFENAGIHFEPTSIKLFNATNL
ncbi:Dymeclin [Aphelenchoides bicaudatus]|nr:Dymeclin [Aphelenchoides bicaudatus]